jgi:hypothetical protein
LSADTGTTDDEAPANLRLATHCVAQVRCPERVSAEGKGGGGSAAAGYRAAPALDGAETRQPRAGLARHDLPLVKSCGIPPPFRTTPGIHAALFILPA